jgi:meckelin
MLPPHPSQTLILTGAGVQNSDSITPDAKDYTTYVTASHSMLLRFGLESAFLFVLFLGQYLLVRLIWHRYVEDPLLNFIDLIYLANMSVVILDDHLSGYYLHGRNQSQHSDTTLRCVQGVSANR